MKYESWGAYLPSAKVGDQVACQAVVTRTSPHSGSFEVDIAVDHPVELLSRAKSPGRVAYEQFWDEGGDAEHMSWDELPADVKATWDKVAQAARAAR